jgi:hypothetical protein
MLSAPERHMARLSPRFVLAVAFTLALPLLGSRVAAQKQILADRPVTMETLLDRIQIEDFPTRYYYELSVGKAKELAEYFTEDAVLDVDGVVAREYTELRNVKGKWMISRRFISSDSGLPDRFDATWKPREHR